MSNGRKPAAKAKDYRVGYLQSPGWFGRRDQWIEAETARAGELVCSVCQGRVDRRHAEIHHLTYAGVTRTAGVWSSQEKHEDLVSVHRRCHEWLHQLLDGDAALRRMRDRVTANRIAIARLRARLRRTVTQMLSGEHR